MADPNSEQFVQEVKAKLDMVIGYVERSATIIKSCVEKGPDSLYEKLHEVVALYYDPDTDLAHMVEVIHATIVHHIADQSIDGFGDYIEQEFRKDN